MGFFVADVFMWLLPRVTFAVSQLNYVLSRLAASWARFVYFFNSFFICFSLFLSKSLGRFQENERNEFRQRDFEFVFSLARKCVREAF